MKAFFTAILTLTISLNTQSQQFDIQGHRGCRGLMPENSLPGFLKAIDIGVTTLEMDVVISGDGIVVVSHDHYFSSDFCVNEIGYPISKKEQKDLNIYRLNYEDIKMFDCGVLGNPDFPEQKNISTFKPRLDEVIERCEQFIIESGKKPVHYNIELKSSPSGDHIHHPDPELFTRLVHETIHELVPPKRVIIQSFDLRILQFWKMRYPQYRISFLTSSLKKTDKVIEQLGFKPDIFSPHYKLINEKIVGEWHENSVRVVPWTVNKITDMEKIIGYGVDGLITDYPNRYFESINSK